jgi:hypothetical protein
VAFDFEDGPLPNFSEPLSDIEGAKRIALRVQWIWGCVMVAFVLAFFITHWWILLAGAVAFNLVVMVWMQYQPWYKALKNSGTRRNWF